jgi:uncharacterized protein YjbI with pentapeptide repeats/YHS domain-containing protein
MKKLSLALAATLLFASSAFAAESAKPEMGGNCTTGLSEGVLFKTSCAVNEIYKGKTYCFSSQGAKDEFLKNPEETINKAKMFYEKNADKSSMKAMDAMPKAENGMSKSEEVPREKISQADALAQINSKTCDLSNKDAGYLEFDKMDLRHCNMVNTSFFGAYLRGANLSGANMQKSYLNLARIEGANLSKADLTDATIFQAIFDKANFEGANLTNARMIGTLGAVNMSGATIKNGRFGLDIGNQPMGAMRFDAIGGNFENTNFEGADINRSNFRFANLRGANLRNTDLFRADFSKADLTGADITGAKMGEAVLDGANMTDVKGLEAIKGYDEAKGKCVNCAMVAETPKAKKLSKAEAADEKLMAAENPAKSFCRMGAKY